MIHGLIPLARIERTEGEGVEEIRGGRGCRKRGGGGGGWWSVGKLAEGDGVVVEREVKGEGGRGSRRVRCGRGDMGQGELGEKEWLRAMNENR